jgi:hypothetical protein
MFMVGDYNRLISLLPLTWLLPLARGASRRPPGMEPLTQGYYRKAGKSGPRPLFPHDFPSRDNLNLRAGSNLRRARPLQETFKGHDAERIDPRHG